MSFRSELTLGRVSALSIVVGTLGVGACMGYKEGGALGAVIGFLIGLASLGWLGLVVSGE